MCCLDPGWISTHKQSEDHLQPEFTPVPHKGTQLCLTPWGGTKSALIPAHLNLLAALWAAPEGSSVLQD